MQYKVRLFLKSGGIIHLRTQSKPERDVDGNWQFRLMPASGDMLYLDRSQVCAITCAEASRVDKEEPDQPKEQGAEKAANRPPDGEANEKGFYPVTVGNLRWTIARAAERPEEYSEEFVKKAKARLTEMEAAKDLDL